jgi:hypothetical protein
MVTLAVMGGRLLASVIVPITPVPNVIVDPGVAFAAVIAARNEPVLLSAVVVTTIEFDVDPADAAFIDAAKINATAMNGMSVRKNGKDKDRIMV